MATVSWSTVTLDQIKPVKKQTYFLSNLRKELISKKVLRNKQTKNPTTKQTRSLHIWKEHKKQSNHMAGGQQQTTVKDTACNACSKPTSDVKLFI